MRPSSARRRPRWRIMLMTSTNRASSRDNHASSFLSPGLGKNVKLNPAVDEDILPHMNAAPSSINHTLYMLACKSSSSYLDLATFIARSITSTRMSTAKLQPREVRSIILDKTHATISTYEIKDGATLGLVRIPDSATYKAIKLMDGRWILARPYLNPSLVQWITDGTVSPPLQESVLLSILDLIPTSVLIDGAGIIFPNSHFAVKRTITFFPRDFPHGQPLILPTAFVQEYCHARCCAEAKAIGYCTIATNTITPKAASLIQCIADAHPMCGCDGDFSASTTYSQNYDEIKSSMDAAEYVAAMEVLCELGIKW